MPFSLKHSVEILERTPAVLSQLLSGLSDEWIHNNEGPDTWSPFDIVGHLIHGEKTDWVPRMEIILSPASDKTFPPFDRFAQIESSKGKTLSELLEEFRILRAKNVASLQAYQPGPEDLEKTGVHPALGVVTLQQLLATWTVHDLNHIAQLSRVMARQYDREVGPWKAYLGIL